MADLRYSRPVKTQSYAYGIRILLALGAFAAGVYAVTTGLRVLDYFEDLHTVSVAAADLRYVACGDGGGEVSREGVTEASCVRLVLPAAAAREAKTAGTAASEELPVITYYAHDAAFDDLAEVPASGARVTVWYSRREPRTLTGPLGSLRALRAGEHYYIDIINTYLSRRRAAAQSELVGVVLLFVVVPSLLWRPMQAWRPIARARRISDQRSGR
jgi:hypothetical protein